MFLNINKDTAVNADHATLVVRGEGSAFYCLELETSVLQDANVVSFYKPIVSFTTLPNGQPQAYMHGIQVVAGQTMAQTQARQTQEHMERLRRNQGLSALERLRSQQERPRN